MAIPTGSKKWYVLQARMGMLRGRALKRWVKELLREFEYEELVVGLGLWGMIGPDVEERIAIRIYDGAIDKIEAEAEAICSRVAADRVRKPRAQAL